MIEYDFILSACRSLDQRICTLIRCTKDPTELLRLLEAVGHIDGLEVAMKAARECRDNPLLEARRD